MPLETFLNFHPQVHPTAYVHSSAQLLGDVAIDAGASIWPTAVLRGDSGAIRIGARANIQDGAVAHATSGLSETHIGAETTVGHRAILHGCTVGSRCLVGMGSILLDGVHIGDDSFVAAGSLVPPNRVFEPRSFILGSPAKRIREVTESEMEWIASSWKIYQTLGEQYRTGAIPP